MSYIKLEDMTQDKLDRLVGMMRAYANYANWKVIAEYESEMEWDGKPIIFQHQETIWMGGYGGHGPYHGAEHAIECLRGIGYDDEEDFKNLELRKVKK